MGRHWHGKGGQGAAVPRLPHLPLHPAPSAVSGRPTKHRKVMELSLSGGRHGGLSAGVSAPAVSPACRSPGGSPRVVSAPAVAAGWSPPREVPSHRGEGLRGSDLGLSSSSGSHMPGFPPASSESQFPLGWCGAGPAVQLRLVQLGLVTPLDLAGFCDSEEDARESFRATLSGALLEEVVSAWRESITSSKMHVRRVAGLLTGTPVMRRLLCHQALGLCSRSEHHLHHHCTTTRMPTTTLALRSP